MRLRFGLLDSTLKILVCNGPLLREFYYKSYPPLETEFYGLKSHALLDLTLVFRLKMGIYIWMSYGGLDWFR